MQNNEKKITEEVSEEVDFSAELQKELSMSYEEAPAELYPSVMAKIEIEKKRSRAKLVRRLGSAVAAVFVFALAVIFIFPRVSGGMVADEFSPAEAAYNKGKAIEDADAVIEKQIDKLLAISKSVENDARQLKAALEVNTR